MSRELAAVLVKPVWLACDDSVDKTQTSPDAHHPGMFSTLSGPSVLREGHLQTTHDLRSQVVQEAE